MIRRTRFACWAHKATDAHSEYVIPVAYPGIFFGGGSTNSVEDRENRDLEAVAP